MTGRPSRSSCRSAATRSPASRSICWPTPTGGRRGPGAGLRRRRQRRAHRGHPQRRLDAGPATASSRRPTFIRCESRFASKGPAGRCWLRSKLTAPRAARATRPSGGSTGRSAPPAKRPTSVTGARACACRARRTASCSPTRTASAWRAAAAAATATATPAPCVGSAGAPISSCPTAAARPRRRRWSAIAVWSTPNARAASAATASVPPAATATRDRCAPPAQAVLRARGETTASRCAPTGSARRTAVAASPPACPACTSDDCISRRCVAGAPLSVCGADGRRCASNADCPRGSSGNPCIAIGVAGGICQ